MNAIEIFIFDELYPFLRCRFYQRKMMDFPILRSRERGVYFSPTSDELHQNYVLKQVSLYMAFFMNSLPLTYVWPLWSILNKTLREGGWGLSSHNPYVDFLELALRSVKEMIPFLHFLKPI